MLIGIDMVKGTGKIERDPLYDTKIYAYELMEEYMGFIHHVKEELHIEMAEEDIHHTGMIGLNYSEITTSLGSIEAKRTSANPHMAALVVELLNNAGIKKGDRIGANFSGSFPALNLAVLAASKAMGAEIVFISSIGSSNYGANHIQLTFPDMAIQLAHEGFLDNPGVAFSIGGSGDIGSDMDHDILDEIIERLTGDGLPLIQFNDYMENIEERQRLLEVNGPILCFVNVGGNTTSLGKDENSFYFGQGLLVEKTIPISNESGLIEIYRNKGIPVIHLLNLKKMTSDYGMPYDPMIIPREEELSLYMKPAYHPLVASIILFLTLLGLFLYRRLSLETSPHIKGDD